MTGSRDENREPLPLFVGCCGAYCRTCAAFREGACRGCKPGYGGGGRDLSKAKCPVKLCCFWEKRLETCADCPAYRACATIRGFQSKKGYKYGKYRESLEFIRNRGYPAFPRLADTRKGPHGRLK